MRYSFRDRSEKSELLDASDISRELLWQNLHELDILNRALGGHAITMEGIKELVTDKRKTYHIADLGCGSGDILKHIADWAKGHGYHVRLTGVDKKPDAISYLNKNCRGYAEISGTIADYRDFLLENAAIDIICCSLFCHHLNDDELIELISDMKKRATTGFIINDLRRNRFAYYGVKCLTSLLRSSLLSKNDGPVSVLRAFRARELDSLLQKADAAKYSIKRKWAFRYLVVGRR